MESWQMLVAGAVCVLVIVGIGVAAVVLMSAPPPTGGGTDNPTSGIPTDTDLKSRNLETPNWNLIMSDGDLLELHSLRGKFVVVDLMQTGECIPCEIQTVHLKSLYESYEGRIEIISLSLVLSDTVQRVANYKSSNDIDWYVGIDTNGVFGSYFNAQSVPTLIIIDDDGYFRWVHVGIWTESEISATLSQLDR